VLQAVSLQGSLCFAYSTYRLILSGQPSEAEFRIIAFLQSSKIPSSGSTDGKKLRISVFLNQIQFDKG